MTDTAEAAEASADAGARVPEGPGRPWRTYPYRPSALPMVDMCPRFVGRPDRAAGQRRDGIDAAADEGTLVHAVMEGLATVPVEGWDAAIDAHPDVGPALAPVVRAAAGGVRGLFGMGLPVVTRAGLGLAAGGRYALGRPVPPLPPAPDARAADARARVARAADGVYCEVGVDPGICMPGTADVVVACGNMAYVVDYKTTRVEREHRLQALAYVIGVFRALPAVSYVRFLIVSPRLGDAHPELAFSRTDLPVLEAELEAVCARASDPFSPGCPGEPCVFCAGNGRCAYQAAGLRDIPVQAHALVDPQAWTATLGAVTPALRGERRLLVKWLEAFVESVKEDDREWARTNPGADMPGFKRVVSPGRASLDRTRLQEANKALMERFGVDADTYLGCCEPVVERVAEVGGFMQGMGADDAAAAVKRTLVPFVRRGADITSFRAEKRAPRAAVAGAAAGAVAGAAAEAGAR